MTELHDDTFEYLRPTIEQINRIATVRGAFKIMARELGRLLPDGPDKTYTLRHLRECAMWANVSITREADGSPRKDPK
jgi:hypothetical protein